MNISRRLQASATACDLVFLFWEQNVAGSNPVAPTNVSARGSFPRAPRLVDGKWAFLGLGNNRVTNGAAERASARVSAGSGGSGAPPATSEIRGSCAGCGGDVAASSHGGGPKLKRSISFLR